MSSRRPLAPGNDQSLTQLMKEVMEKQAQKAQNVRPGGLQAEAAEELGLPIPGYNAKMRKCTAGKIRRGQQ